MAASAAPAPSPPTGAQPYRVLSLFSGMAGMDLAFGSGDVTVHRDSVPAEWVDRPASTPGFVTLKKLPFTGVFQNDILRSAHQIAEQNGWAHNYVEEDIRELLKKGHPFPEADVVVGGFPCQDFSHAGKRQGFDSERGTLYRAFVDVVRLIQPAAFIAENVNGLLTMKGNPIDIIVADFASIGYDVRYQLIKCEEYGIPQTRWRVIITGTHKDKVGRLAPDIPCPNRRVPIATYFQHLKEPEETDDQAQTVYSKAKRLARGQGQQEARLQYPGPTMRAEHHGNIEFRRLADGANGQAEPGLPERRLTVREAALIQTFPPDCILTSGNKPTMIGYKPIGNAVPPLLGYIVARHVLALLSPPQPPSN